jgi:hypothetical protein
VSSCPPANKQLERTVMRRHGRAACASLPVTKLRRVCTLVLLVPGAALAGGDYVPGRVANFSGDDGSYAFTFAADRELVQGCQTLEVRVRYSRVPWYSWLPFVHTSHPTKDQTDLAAAMLRQAAQTSRSVLFGYVGYGLVPSGERCTFVSRGLVLERDGDFEVVLSFHDPV